MASFYDRHVLPWLIDRACGHADIARQRAMLVPKASGRVLELGMGSALNLPHYDAAKVDKLWGLEPAERMRARAAGRVAASPITVHWLDLPGESIPLPDHGIDTVVMTYTLCSIDNAAATLAEVRRVLKPDGRLLFSEHGASPDPVFRRWQDRLNPLWRRIGGGCQLNKPIDRLIEAAGFTIQELETGRLMPNNPLAGVADYNYRGRATPR